MHKRIKIINLLVLLMFILTGCSVLESPDPEEPTAPPPQAKVAQVWLTQDKGVLLADDQDRYAVESLENYYNFYSAYDTTQGILSLVIDNQWLTYTLKDSQILDASGNSLGSYALDGDQVTVGQDFLRVLNLEVMPIKDGHIVAPTAYMPKKGQAVGSLTSYDFDEPVSLDQETEVEVLIKLNSEWLVLFNNQLYWAAESNLTYSPPEPSEGMSVERPLLAAWDLYGNKSDQALDNRLDVVIPKWLSLQDASGNFNDLYRPQYHANVKNQGKDLWVLANNSFDPDLTGQALGSLASRQSMVNSLITYATSHGIKGINIDFENMHLADSDLFVQFVAELYTQTLANDLVLSVAVTVPGGSDNWSKVYDRKRLARVSDYITLMAYDQYWASSQVAGPVAGYTWVKDHVEGLLSDIPNHKLILGIPFYTRVWYESFSVEVPNAMKVRSRSVFMASPDQLITDYNPVKVWDQVNRQYYYAYMKDNEVIKFWYDDEAAIAEKAMLMKTYNLAGLAAWSLGFERDTIWPALRQVMEEAQ